MATILDGKAIAAETIETVKRESADLLTTRNIRPGLAVVIVGDDPASAIYVGSKERMARECGFHSIKKTMPEATSTEELEGLITTLNGDRSIHGILVQLPLPDHIDTDRIVQTIAPEKDVDGFHYINVGKLVTGAMQTAHVPCTPSGCMVLIERARGADLAGLHAVVLGRSNIVGKPMAHLLLAANATVTIAHSRTADLPGLCRNADILVAAVGRPRMVGADFIKPGATVVDVGINRLAPVAEGGKGRIVGDVDFDQVVDKAGAITTVPGGVGPMTIAMLMTATLRAARLSAA